MTGTITAPAVLVLGATGVVGRGVARAALHAGKPVVAVARDREALAALAATHAGADLTPLAGSVADDAASAELAGHLHALGRPLASKVGQAGGWPTAPA